MAGTNYGTEKKHNDFFNISYWPPPKSHPCWDHRKEFMCLISGKERKKMDPVARKLFRGDFGVKKGSQTGHFGSQKV